MDSLSLDAVTPFNRDAAHYFPFQNRSHGKGTLFYVLREGHLQEEQSGTQRSSMSSEASRKKFKSRPSTPGGLLSRRRRFDDAAFDDELEPASGDPVGPDIGTPASDTTVTP